MKKVGRNVYGSGDTIVTKTSHFFSGSHVGGGGGGLVRGTLRYMYALARNEHSYSINMLFRLIGLIPKSTTKASLYGGLSMTLVRVNVKALLSRANTLDGN